jgi:hypothetical protein
MQTQQQNSNHSFPLRKPAEAKKRGRKMPHGAVVAKDTRIKEFFAKQKASTESG